MIDDHYYPANWGVRPVLFHIGSFGVPSYEFFVTLALVVGILVYLWEARNKRTMNENTFFIAVAAIIGGTIGAKIPLWIYYFPKIIATFPDPTYILVGRTITGGLIGGYLGVVLVKRKLGITERRGNLFAPAIALGVAIGRIGCFLRGCCYGVDTSLPWGVDFGDGIPRHPTQLYEAGFMLLLFGYLQYAKRKGPEPGQLFVLLIKAYFSYRFLSEFIRVHPSYWGLTFFQWLSLAVLIWLNKGRIITYIDERTSGLIENEKGRNDGRR